MTDPDEKWMLNVQNRLRDELNELYLEAEDDHLAQSPLAPTDSGHHDGSPAKQRIAQILRAFHQIEAGEFSHCTNCGKTIESARLEDDVAASTCGACAAITYS